MLIIIKLFIQHFLDIWIYTELRNIHYKIDYIQLNRILMIMINNRL